MDPRSPARLARRRFLTLTGAATALAFGANLPPASAGASGDPLPADPFTLGVASGDPLLDAVVIWTRLAPSPFERPRASPGPVRPPAQCVPRPGASPGPARIVPGRGTPRLPSGSHDCDLPLIGGRAVDGDIRIGVGKCLRIFAYFGLLFGVPATGLLVMLHLQPPSTVYWLLAWCTGQAILGGLVYRSGTRAQRRQRAASVNVAVERAIRLG